GGVVLVLYGPQVADGVKDDDGRGVLSLKVGEKVDEGEPVACGWLGGKGEHEEADVIAEAKVLAAYSPFVLWLLGDVEGGRWLHGLAAEFAAVLPDFEE